MTFYMHIVDSEWLGLAPHIEEDVASSSISQDSMGHAAMYYKLLEELGAGNADDLAHARPAEERKNSILAERVNGQGYYMETPEYDWAYAVVRNYLYTHSKKDENRFVKTKLVSTSCRSSGKSGDGTLLSLASLGNMV